MRRALSRIVSIHLKIPRHLKILAAGFLAVGVSGFVLGSDNDLFLRIYKGIDIFGRVYKEIATNYVDEIDPDRFMRAGIDGMLKTLDPYTVYIGEKENGEIDLVTTGKYGGVGITIGMRDGIITVVNLIEGFSAAKQGIQVGDRILEVDGSGLTGVSFDEVRSLVRGAPGTELRMKIDRDGEASPLEFVLVREEIPVRNVTYSGFVQNGIGYVRLERFSRTAGDDLRNALKELKSKGTIKGLILDLRDNPGGLLDMAVDVTAKFLPESSLVVSTRGRRSDADRSYYTSEKPMYADGPLAVLVDRGSASASEIVAGAIQDLDRGVIVGTRTFGKGLVQTITRLSENTSLKITTGRYFTPSGRSIQEVDYFNRMKDGRVTVVPDSLRKEYRTAHNRSVFEGGGVKPDSTVVLEESNRLLVELNRKAMFFKFANRYAAKKKSIPESFEVTDALLNEFGVFLKERHFTYNEDAESKISELKETAKEGRYGKKFFETIGQLEAAVQAEKERAFERYKKELKTTLKLEIIGRIRGEKARIEASLEDDHQLDIAMALLKGKNVYDFLLTGKSK